MQFTVTTIILGLLHIYLSKIKTTCLKKIDNVLHMESESRYNKYLRSGAVAQSVGTDVVLHCPAKISGNVSSGLIIVSYIIAVCSNY